MTDRRKTDWYCARCRRPLANTGARAQRKDTVRPLIKDDLTRYVHEGCGGQVEAGK